MFADDDSAGVFLAGGTAPASVNISDTQFTGNGASGLDTNFTGSQSATIAVSHSEFHDHRARGIHAFTADTASLQIAVQDCAISSSGASAIFAEGAGTRLTATRISATGNAFGFAQDTGAVFESLRDNVVRNNMTDVFGTITTLTGP